MMENDDVEKQSSTISVGAFVVNEVSRYEGSKGIFRPNPEMRKPHMVPYDSDIKLAQTNAMNPGILSREGGSSKIKIFSYLIELWTWIRSFFKGANERNVTQDVFATPLPPSSGRIIVTGMRKKGILKGRKACPVLSSQTAQAINYPVRRLEKYAATETACNIQRDLMEMNKKSDDVHSMIEKGTPMFRNMAMTNFEKKFKAVSKTRIQSCGSMMDVKSHIRWLSLAKIPGDKNGEIFKQFAGKKILLNFSEYKDVIEYICKQTQLDYWEMINTMANVKLE